jgi:cyclopropane fatty-acyl-phospholipid synthase-like methyltransferase
VEELIRLLAGRPGPFAPGPTPFWTDERLAAPLLATHLDPDTDAASRRPETIVREVDRLVQALALGDGSRLLDLGCGPGLYAAAFAARGVHVAGVDASPAAVAHARETVPAGDFRVADYRELDDRDAYDAAVLIYHDFGVLSERDRAAVLARVHRALRPGGRLALDVVAAGATPQATSAWSAHAAGFWRPGPHLLLERTLAYDDDVSCREHAVVEPSGAWSLYRFWEQRFTRERLEHELAGAGLAVVELTADLAGAPWSPGSETIAVVAAAQSR